MKFPSASPLMLRRAAMLCALLAASVASSAEIRIGMIGIDTSHAINFTEILNNPQAKDHVPGAKVVGAYKASSPDVQSSWSLVDGYEETLKTKYGVKMYGSIEELARNVDALMIESVDGRPHLEQAKAAIPTGKPLFVDKPMAGSLKDALEIFALAKRHKVPVFSASSLRYARETQAVRNGQIGRVLSAETSSPAKLEPHHTDLFWYGIHGVESLITVMGPGIESVTRQNSEPDGLVSVGRWKDGRTGTFREIKGFGGKAQGNKGEASVGKFDGYAPLMVEVVKFFQTSVSPVPEQETIAILAFMEADALSKARGGKPVKISEVLEQAGWRAP